jgi:hypothetical protein
MKEKKLKEASQHLFFIDTSKQFLAKIFYFGELL